MKFKGTAGMMVVFLSLGLYYFFIDLPTEKKKAKEKKKLLKARQSEKDYLFDREWELLKAQRKMIDNGEDDEN